MIDFIAAVQRLYILGSGRAPGCRFDVLRREGPVSRAITALFGIAAVTFMLVSTQATAQKPPILNRGDAVVTAFPGVIVVGDVPPDVHPLDRTYIDLEGSSAQVFDLSRLGAGPTGQLADAPSKFKIKARDVGQVFGVTLDDGQGTGAPSIYLAATSMFGLQIVAPDPGSPGKRILAGQAGAQWMPGQFGVAKGGGAGSIWKVDGRSGAISLFATIRTDSAENSGPGLGNITFDKVTRQFFVSDLETGLIHRLSNNGEVRGTFDHGVAGRPKAGLDAVGYDAGRRVAISDPKFNSEDAATWGFTDYARMVFGLAANGNRLYYAVAQGPQIWSVGLNQNGGFADDARLEIDVRDTPNSNPVTDILFDGDGTMYLSQRGQLAGAYDYKVFAAPQQSVVLRYRRQANGAWELVPQEYAIGLPPEFRTTQGGIALNYGYDRAGNISYGACRQTLWTTGEHLREGDPSDRRVAAGGPTIVHGLQGEYKSMVRPANEPPYQTWFVDYDGHFEDGDVNGHIGAIAIYNECEQQQGRLEPSSGAIPGIDIEKRCYAGPFGSRIRCAITVVNNGAVQLEDWVSFADLTRISVGPGAGTVVAIADFKTSDPRWECAASERKDLTCRIPGAALRPGVSLSVEVWIDTRILIIDGNYGFRNCATLSYRDWKRVICATGGSDITVEKTGPAVCIAGGPCTFTVTVSNKGSEPFDGPVLITDSMTVDGAPVNAPITAISPPLGCSPEPTSLPFSCMAQEKLAPGQSDSYSVTIQMPAPGRGYRAQNCVAIFDPLLERDPQLFNATLRPAKAEQPGGQYIGRSCIWIRVQIPLSPPVPGIPLIPNYPQCPDGLTALDNGNCVCALNTLWSAETRSCLPPISVCYDSSRRTPDGQCCPRDSIWNARFGGCERPCYDTSRRTPDGQCCPWGQVWHRETKSCGPTRIHACPDGRPMIAATNTCACPANLRWNWLTKACERPNERSHCTDPARRMPSGQCCPSGTNWDGRSCVRQSCLRGMILLNGKCTIQPNCGSGTRFSPAAGECIAIGTVCRQGAHNVGGNCVPNTFICRHGTHPDGNGHCVADAKVCGKGQRLVGGACVASVQTCGSGTHLIGGKCVPNRQQICRKGQIRTADGGCGSPPPKSETKKSNVKRHTSVDGSDSLKTTGKSGGGSTVKSGKSGGSTKTVSKTGRKAVPKRTENEKKKQQ